ncbi:MAG: substrate-binding domain-containing protein [Ignavibacteriaceae bacterium]
MPNKKYLYFLLAITLFFFNSSCNTKNDRIKEIDFTTKSHEQIDNSLNVSKPKLYVAISTMLSPLETFNLYKDLVDYISAKLKIPIVFKQRKTYGEVNKLLREKKVDFAFICTGAYIQAKKEFPIELLAVPVIDGKPYYKAYIIVNKESKINSFEELKGKSFAFTDPLSNTGYSYVINILKNKKTTPEKFFGKTIFTYAHDYSIQAVARNLVDGATVDGLVYEYLKHFQPGKLQDIKIIQKSKDFGIPPFVVQPNMDPVLRKKLKDIMLNMHNDPKGKELLNKIMIDKFIPGDDSLYR